MTISPDDAKKLQIKALSWGVSRNGGEMEKLERWEEIAYKLGSYDCTNTSTGFDPCYEMVRAESLPEPWVPGHYVETEPACQRIAALEAERDRLAVDAVNLNRLRRGLCEILGDDLDGIDVLLHKVAAMREEAEQVLHQLGCWMIESGHMAEGERYDDAVKRLIAERDRLRARVAEMEDRERRVWDQTGARMIAAERGRQRAQWADKHDDGHTDGELLCAARQLAEEVEGTSTSDIWGLAERHRGPIQRLCIAGALIAAEIDRRLRVAVRPCAWTFRDTRCAYSGPDAGPCDKTLQEISTRPGLLPGECQDIAAEALANEPPPSQ